MGRGISPPPPKRQKREQDESATEFPMMKSTSPLAPLARGAIRIFSWNINGITPFLQTPITGFFSSQRPEQTKEAPASLRGFLHRHDWPAILFLQEVKIAALDAKTQEAVRKAVNDNSLSETSCTKGPTYRVDFTLPTDKHNARGLRGSGKVYGVCSIVRSDLFSDLKAHVRTVDWDQEGRVSVVELTSSLGKYALFNIYAVNGTDNVYRDTMTGAVRGTRHDRKISFHRSLSKECGELVEKGWHVVLAGDMNVAPSGLDGYPRLRTFPNQHVLNRADFKARFLGAKGEKYEEDGCVFKGVDVWRKLNRDERRYSYYPRGRPWGTSCDRVDYAIADSSTWEDGLVTAAGILNSEFERGPSDHVPIWVDVKVEHKDLDQEVVD